MIQMENLFTDLFSQMKFNPRNLSGTIHLELIDVIIVNITPPVKWWHWYKQTDCPAEGSGYSIVFVYICIYTVEVKMFPLQLTILAYNIG